MKRAHSSQRRKCQWPANMEGCSKWLTIREMQKLHWESVLPWSEWQWGKHIQPMLMRMWTNRASYTLLVGMQICPALVESIQRLLRKLKANLSRNRAMPRLSISLSDSKSTFHRHACTLLLMTALPQRLSSVVYTHNGTISAPKKNDVVTGRTQTEWLKMIPLSIFSQSQKGKC